MSLQEVNGVHVNIVEEYHDKPIIITSRDSTFIFGTAAKGPKNTPVRPGSTPVESIFGNVQTGKEFETSLVRGFYEFAYNTPASPDVALVRVGKTSPARAILYENKSTSIGDLSWTVESGNIPKVSFIIESLEESERYNTAKVVVESFDENGELADGFPTSIRIELPGDDGDIVKVQYLLSKTPGAPGVISSVDELVRAINANPILNSKVRAYYTPLVKDGYEITITSTSNIVDSVYDINPTDANSSWGDKVLAINKAYVTQTIDYIADAGSTMVPLDVAPIKSFSESIQTISNFIRIMEDELVYEVNLADVGKTTITKDLFCKTVNGWNPGYTITGESGVWSPVVKVKRNGASVAVTLDAANYIINATGENAGTITIAETDGTNPKPFALGDKYYVSYRYEVTYKEAKNRSDLVLGSDRSYFIYGDNIIFGAPQPNKICIRYTTNVYFDPSDIELTDSRNGIIKFVNTASIPSVGTKVKLDIEYQPELPAVTGSVIETGVIQNGGFSGGSSGKFNSKREYLKYVKEAMAAVGIYPRKYNVIMGLYLDDEEYGPNEETGAYENRPMNWFTEIFPYIDDVSSNVSECSIIIPVKNPTNLSVDGQNQWIDRLINNSTTDKTRAANIIDTINYYKADVTAAAYIVSIPQVLNGAQYMANSAIVYAAMKSNLKVGESMVHKKVPGSIKNLGVAIQNREIIGKLNAKRYTATIVNHQGEVIIADAPTLGLKGVSQFDRQFVRDAVYIAVEIARAASEVYIGKTRSMEYLNSMKKDILKGLATLSKTLLSDFYVELIPSPDGYITGETRIKLSLETSVEIRRINIETYAKLANVA